MPMYDLLCGSCGHRFEVFQKMSDSLDIACEKCHGKTEVVIHAPQSITMGWSQLRPAVCQSCRKRDNLDVPYEKGGCSKGKRCRGYVPINMQERKRVVRKSKRRLP